MENLDSDDSVSAEPTVSEAAHGGVEPAVEVERTQSLRMGEDGLREDMFVDCPDEIEDSQTPSEGKEEVLDNPEEEEEEVQSRPSGEAMDLIAEIAVLRAKVEETAAEKESIVRKYEEEIATLKEIGDRVLTYIPATIHQGAQFSDDSVEGNFFHVEQSVSLLAEKYNQFLSGAEKLKLGLTDVVDIPMEDEVGIFSVAHDKLLELRAKEVDLVGKLGYFGTENTNLLEQLDQNKAVIGKLEAEVDQERTRYSNTKEKLSMAVTKGKALVQQRDSLKQALAEKTNEMEKCLIHLQEKTSALESAEQSRDLLLQTEMMVAQLQESLTQKEFLLQKCEEILSEATSEENQSLDLVEKLRGILDERNALKGLTGQAQRLSNTLSSVSFPEDIFSNGIEAQVTWLAQSFFLSKEDVAKLEEEVVQTREASKEAVDRLVASVLAETQEKNYLQEELEDLRSKYEVIVEKEQKASLERGQIVDTLLKASGISIDTPEHVDITQAYLEKIIEKIKEESSDASMESSSRAEDFERLQSLLFVRDQEVALCKGLLEEGMIDRAELDKISENLAHASEELRTLKDEKASLQAELEKAEDKGALIREKLSMAVKKGKGLVQERENLRRVIDEKTVEIERLNTELLEKTSTCDDLTDQIKKLAADINTIPELEARLSDIQGKNNQLEQFLAESNGLLQKVLDSIERIDVPDGLVFKEPVEKVMWLAGYLSECQTAKTLAQQELEAAVKSMDEALLDAQNAISKIQEEKTELEVAKVKTEEELQKASEEVALQKSKFAEVSATIKSFEDALTAAEENIANLSKEKEDALVGKSAVEMELLKLNELNMTQISQLAEADKTIKSLEDAFSEAQNKFAFLAEENQSRDIGRSDMEEEMKNLKAEVDSQATTIKSLQNAILDAENRVSSLVTENNVAEQEISTLNSKLQGCYQELDEFRGRTQNSSLGIARYLSTLQQLQRDDTPSSLLKHCFQKKIESLQGADILLKEITDCFSDNIGSELLQNHHVMEDDQPALTLLPDGLDEVFKTEMVNGDVNNIDDENISLHMERTVEGLRLKDKNTVDQIERCSEFLDDFISTLLKRLRVAKDGVIVVSELIQSLKQRVSEVELDSQAQQNMVSSLGTDMKTLLSACTQATEDLEVQLQNYSTREVENLQYSPSAESEVFNPTVEGTRDMQIAERLLFASRQIRNLSEETHKVMNTTNMSMEDLQNELRETKTKCEELLEDRDANLKKIAKLEADLGELERLYNETKGKVADYQVKEEELIAARSTATMREREIQEFPLSASQISSIFEKINAMDISFVDSDAGDVHKLFYIIDKFDGLQQQVNSESQEKIVMKSVLEKQELKLDNLMQEVERLETEVENLKSKNELLQQQINSESQEKNAMKSLLDKQELEVDSLMQEAERFKTEVENLNSRNEMLQQQINSESQEKNAVKSLLEKQELEMDSMMQETERFKTEVENLNSRNEMLQQQINSESQEKNAMKSVLEKQELEMDNLMQEADRFKTEVENLNSRNELLQQQISSESQEKIAMKSVLEKQELEKDNLTQEAERFKTEVENLYSRNELLQKQINSESHENSTVEHLKEEVKEHFAEKQEVERIKADLALGLESIIRNWGGDDLVEYAKTADVTGLLPVLEKMVRATKMETEDLKTKNEDLNTKLAISLKAVDDLSSKVKLSEGANHIGVASPEKIKEKGISEPSMSHSEPEISEIQDLGPVGKAVSLSSAPSAAHARTLRKGSSDHLAISIDPETERLIDSKKSDEEKGYPFKSLNTSGLVPRQGKMIADRIDGVWVSGSRGLMSHPRGRLGLIAYCLFLHLWVLGTIL